MNLPAPDLAYDKTNEAQTRAEIQREDGKNIKRGTLKGSDFATIRGQIPGTATNDNAAAGNVGEYIETVVAFGSAVSLTTGVAANIASISLTPGDWDITVLGTFTGGATTTVARLIASASLASATLDTTNGRGGAVFGNNATVFNSVQPTAHAGPVRFSLAATSTVYFVGFAEFAVSTCSAFGTIRARRMR